MIKPDDWYLCLDCKPNERVIGEFNDIYFLTHNKVTDVYSIGDVRGHADLIYAFPAKPTKDPLFMVEEDLPDDDPRLDQSTDWIQSLREAQDQFKFVPNTAFELVNEFTKAGWSQKKFGDIYFYIVHLAGELIEKYEQRVA